MFESPQFVRLHRRQFALQNRPLDIPGWSSKRTPWGQFLSWHPELKVRTEASESRFILGDSFSKEGGGRHICLEAGQIKLDSCALATLYFGDTENGPLITSSPALAAHLSGHPSRKRRFTWQTKVSWFILPSSPVRGFRKLLRDQILDTTTLQVRHFDRSVRPMETLTQATNALSDHLVSYFSALEGKRIVLTLTAGLDSRTLLAAALASQVKFETFTLDVGPTSNGDVAMAKKISDYFGIKHTVGTQQLADHRNTDTDTLQLHCLDAHHDGINVVSVPNGLYRSLDKDTVLVRGGCFEVGRDFYGTQFSALTKEIATASRICDVMGIDTLRNPEAEADVEEWLQWRRAHDDGLDLGNSFYLDQRLGGWLSMGELCHDALPALSVQPANADVVLSALATGSLPERQSGKLQKDVVSTLVPELNRFAINPVSLQARLKGTGKKILKKFSLR